MTPPPESPGAGDAPPLPLSSTRRRLLQGGLAAAPVLMTVASRPVFGQECQSPSAAMSMPSSHVHAPVPCSGLTPDQWKAIPEQWPSPYLGQTPTTTSMNSQFAALYAAQQPTLYHCPTTGLGGHVFGGKTMINVCGMTEGGRNVDTLGRYIVAALLNARSGRTPVLDEGGVRNMWNDMVNRGYYEPTAGVRWTASDIVAYLKTTMG
jgi:hypothetical protein